MNKITIDGLTYRVVDLDRRSVGKVACGTDSERINSQITILFKLDVTPESLETPFHAWLRTICEDNGIEYNGDVPEQIKHAIEHNKLLSKFKWFLS